MPAAVRCLNGNFCFLRPASAAGGDDLLNGSCKSGARLFRDSPRIEVSFRDSRRPGHSRRCHFFRHAGTCRVYGRGLLTRSSSTLVLGLLVPHVVIVAPNRSSRSPISHTWGV